MTTDKFAQYDAAYVLGALSPADRSEFEDHVKTCPACATSVGELAGLPGLMSRVSIDQLSKVAEPVPETLLPALARAVRRERGHRRLAVWVGAAAAACLITGGAMALTRSDSPAPPAVASSGSTAPGTATLAFAPVVPVPVTATARLVDLAWGTRIDMICAYRKKGVSHSNDVTYAMFVIDRKGAAEEVATWKALPNREINVTGTSSRVRRDIAAVEIRTLKGRTLLRLRT